MRKRFTLAAGAAALVLLALPSLANARPGTSPDLVQRSGRFVVVHSDHEDGTATQRWMLVNGTDRLPIRAPEVWIDPGARVRLEGTIQNGALVLSDSQTTVTELAAAPSAADAIAAAPAQRTVAVIPMGFSGAPGVGSLPSAGTISAALGSLDQYYQEQTYGQIAVTSTVLPAVTISGSPSTCNSNPDPLYAWLSAAEAQLPASFSEASYQHIVLLFPSVTTCPAVNGVSGVAEIGGKHVWINGDFTVRSLAHELGHNLGLKHAGGLLCTASGSPSPVGDSCNASSYPYGDPFDAMGKASVVRQMSMEHKLQLQLLPASAVKVVGASGSYRLAPMETLSGTAELLRIPKPGGGNYFVEYRQPIGAFDSQPPLLSGVLIRTEAPAGSDANAPDTSLVDMHPGAVADWSDAAMDVGQVFSDPLAGVTIQNMGQDPTGVTLQLNVPLDTVPPSALSGLTGVASGTSVALSWAAAGDDYAVDYYRVLRDGTQVGTPAATGFTDTGLTPGSTVTYSVAAIDAGGNAGAAATIKLAIPDTDPPGAPTRVKAKVSKDGKVSISWGDATDDGHVASYRVLRNGTPIASGSGDAYVDKSPKIARNRATVTYSVVAVDLAGNVGPAGRAAPLRSALLRKLGASGLKVARVQVGARQLLRVKGTVSDAKARCRLRVGTRSTWHACKPKASGAFSASLPARGATPVTLSLRDALGRVKLQTLRVR